MYFAFRNIYPFLFILLRLCNTNSIYRIPFGLFLLFSMSINKKIEVFQLFIHTYYMLYFRRTIER